MVELIPTGGVGMCVPVMRDSLKRILLEVCEKRGVTIREVVGRGRDRALVEARREFVTRARAETNASYPAIGRAMNRDHTTAIHLHNTPPVTRSLHVPGLSPREKEALHLWCLGYGRKRIGDELGISSRTVSKYMYRIKEKAE